MMMLVPRRNNFDLFDDLLDESFFNSRNKVMKTDIKELEDSYELIVDLPGFNKEDIKISTKDGYLTISATTDSVKDENKKDKYVRRERYSGSFSRSFYVGDITKDNIKASFKNGVLTVSLPKEEKEIEDDNKYIEIDD